VCCAPAEFDDVIMPVRCRMHNRVPNPDCGSAEGVCGVKKSTHNRQGGAWHKVGGEDVQYE
jgi:hypothetical protein